MLETFTVAPAVIHMSSPEKGGGNSDTEKRMSVQSTKSLSVSPPPLGKFEGAATSAFGSKGGGEGGGIMKRAPKIVRCFLAEFLGTLLLVLFGDGAIGQYKYLEGEGIITRT